MKRKLILLNITLLLLIGIAGWRLREEWRAADLRAQAILQKRIPPAPVPPIAPAPVPAPVLAANYAQIAEKDLFSKDRNPTVIIDPPKIEAPKPMPPLPLLHGVMNLPSGPIAIVSEKANARHVGVHAGDRIGEFKVLALNNREISFEWEGQVVTRGVDKLIDRGSPASAPPQAQATPVAAAAVAPPAAVPAPASPAIAAIPKEATPTDDGSYRYTDQSGKKWLLRQTPFGLSKVEDKGTK